MNILVGNIHHALGVCVAKVAVVWQAEVDLSLVERVLDLVGVDTGGEAGDDFLALELMRGMEDVVVDQDVVAQEVKLRG